MRKEIKKAPTIRFRGFTEDWEQRKLGEIAEFNPKEILPNEFEYVDLESVVGTEMISHRRETRITAPSRAQRVAVKGDLFYQTVRPYQKNNYLFEKDDKDYVFSTGYAQLRPYGDGHFLLGWVQTESFVKKVLDSCTGTSYPAINSNDLATLEILYAPNISEQQKIGQYLAKLDNLITLHQRKFDQLKTAKKFFLQNMFPAKGEKVPRIRFHGFTGDWEQRKVSEMCSIATGKSNTQDKIEDGKYPFYVRSPIIERSNKYLYDEEAVLTVGDGVGTGKVFHYVNGKYDLHQRCYRMYDFSDKLNAKYFFQVFSKMFYRRVMAMTAKTSVDSVRMEMIADMEIPVPSIEEQVQISRYLEDLDHLITLHQRKLDQLKALKKFMLQNLFI